MTTRDLERLAKAVRADADGLRALEAAYELIISSGWLNRDDFAQFIHHGTGMAAIDWEAAISTHNAGGLPSSAGEKRMVRLAVSLAGQASVILGDAVTGIDACNLSIIAAAVHSSGRRQVPGPIEEARHHLHPPGMMSP